MSRIPAIEAMSRLMRFMRRAASKTYLRLVFSSASSFGTDFLHRFGEAGLQVEAKNEAAGRVRGFVFQFATNAVVGNSVRSSERIRIFFVRNCSVYYANYLSYHKQNKRS